MQRALVCELEREHIKMHGSQKTFVQIGEQRRGAIERWRVHLPSDAGPPKDGGRVGGGCILFWAGERLVHLQPTLKTIAANVGLNLSRLAL